MTEDDLYELNGVKTTQTGPDTVRECGWQPSPPEELAALAEPPEEPDKPRILGDLVFLWEAVWVACGGKYPPFNWQLTGSCVNGGANNGVKILIGQELVTKPQPESWVEPFTLHAYGLSRYYGWGAVTEGEGSFGTAMAKALGDGILPADAPGLDRGHACGPAVVYDAATEYKWSSVRNCPDPLRQAAKAFPVTTTRVRSLAQAEDELRKRNPLTWAGNWGGQGRGVVRGTANPVLTMPRRESWNHQQSVWGFWVHPELGRLWYVQNQWWNPGTTRYETRGRSIWRITQAGVATPMHGEHPPHGLAGRPPFPPGGYWITDRDMDYQIRTGEVCSLQMVKGFVGRKLDFGNV